MGEYFAWVNVDKRERIGMGVFGSGFKVMEPCWIGNNDIDAVCTLLEDRWRGDLVAYCGDQSPDYWPETTGRDIPTREEWGGAFLDYAEENFEDVVGLFKEAEGLTYMVFGDPEVDELPYAGPFTCSINHRRFVVNHSRALYYDRTRTPIRCVYPHQLGGDERIVRFDPFPALFAKDNRLSMFCDHKNRYFEQDWVGDSVEVTDDAPPRSYLDVSSFYNYWVPSLIADDETLIAAMESEEFESLRASGMRDMDALKELLPEHVVKGPIRSPRVWPRTKD